MTYSNVTKLLMTSGGGMGGARWYEYIKETPDELLVRSEDIVKVTRVDDKQFYVNKKNIVKIARFDYEITISKSYFNNNEDFFTNHDAW